ncbi:hypothetical protein BS50DRAFT_622397 [Corynespora cassiicola Philippines]|uniref:Linalool dehydratase/isomerase domain-containing protein n=1 Tax=Corynespora cassiicola Philippines TaxID=1448308 RepID=A0A2T2NI34_CORCC|nr:hypothetical protein BS50DRAFT_622397 [Corynespora cassiicola Philippines]
MPHQSFPTHIALDLSPYPKLTSAQAGHLRHFHNLSSAPDGQWPHMGAQDPDQAFLDAYRYQLATMLYASALTHFHRLPAMRSLFKKLMRQLIHKMLRNEVWGYWYLTSQSGIRVDPDIKELRRPWADPIVRENIMYSGHLLLMTSLYGTLFDEDEFEREGSITFRWDPMFWGMGGEKYEYDCGKLQRAILKQMEEAGWVGVCCEPNIIFVVCNQFPLLGVRYNDIKNGTNIVEGVLDKYWKALQEKKMIASDGLFADFLLVKQHVVKPPLGVGWTAWASAFMNAWNPQHVRENFERQAAGFITQAKGEITLQHPAVGTMIRSLAVEKNASTDDENIIAEARSKFLAATENKPPAVYMQPLFGYIVQWLSELGKVEELNSLLAYADRRFSPTWEKGGLYYPRNDQILDENADWTFVDPFSGNAAIGYARLNVENGQRKMYEQAWTKDDISRRAWVHGIDLSHGIDCLRGQWNEDMTTLVITLRPWEDKPVSVDFTVKNLAKGQWAVYEKGNLVNVYDVAAGGGVKVSSVVRPNEEVDFYVMTS